MRMYAWPRGLVCISFILTAGMLGVTKHAQGQHRNDGWRLGVGYELQPLVEWDARGLDNAPTLDPRANWLSSVMLEGGYSVGAGEQWGTGIGVGFPVTLGHEARLGAYLEPSVTFGLIPSKLLLRGSLRGGIRHAVGRVGEIDVELRGRWYGAAHLQFLIPLEAFTLAIGGGADHQGLPVLGLRAAYTFDTSGPEPSQQQHQNYPRQPPRYQQQPQSYPRQPPRHQPQDGPSGLDVVVGVTIGALAIAWIIDNFPEGLARAIVQCGRKTSFKFILSRLYQDKTLRDHIASRRWNPSSVGDDIKSSLHKLVGPGLDEEQLASFALCVERSWRDFRNQRDRAHQ